MDFRRLMALAEFDDRGARIEWKPMDVRVDGQVRQAVVFNAPGWVTKALMPHLESRGARKLRLRPAKEYWLESYILPHGLDPELSELLQLLSSVCSVGRPTKHVDICLALDLYKIPEEGVDPQEWPNTQAGDLVNRSKYRGEHRAFRQLVGQMTQVMQTHPDYRAIDAVLSIPGQNAARPGHGERLARAVASDSNVDFVRTTPTYARRPPSKEGFELKSDDISIEADIRGQRVVIVDDVYRSGNSMSTVASTARDLGAASILGLVAAKTLRN